LPPSSFLGQPDTWTYVWKNLTIAAGVYGRLPEVFSTNPLAGQINGSLWTLKFEVWMYGLLALLGLLSRPLLLRGVNLLPPACIALAVIGLAQHLRVYLTEHVVDERFRLLGMFFLGSAALHLRSRLVLDWRALALLGAVLLAASGQSGAFRLFYPFVIGYLVLVLAYRPRGRILQFNRLGDFSYGLYIYAFPVQQTLMLYFPALTIAQHVACSTVVTSGLAIASWFLIEKPALDWNRESARTRRRAATGAAPYRGLQPTLAGPAASSVDESPPDAATR
jgi:peptidoglycan/LPS O-acetylase OafA/YrhL